MISKHGASYKITVFKSIKGRKQKMSIKQSTKLGFPSPTTLFPCRQFYFLNVWKCCVYDFKTNGRDYEFSTFNKWHSFLPPPKPLVLFCLHLINILIEEHKIGSERENPRTRNNCSSLPPMNKNHHEARAVSGKRIFWQPKLFTEWFDNPNHCCSTL